MARFAIIACEPASIKDISPIISANADEEEATIDAQLQLLFGQIPSGLPRSHHRAWHQPITK